MYSDALQTCGYNRFEEGQKEKRMIKGRVGCVAGSVFILCTERKIAGLPDASGKGGSGVAPIPLFDHTRVIKKNLPHSLLLGNPADR